MRNIDILKQLLKDTASQIRTIRLQHKEAQRNGLLTANGFLFQLLQLQYSYRHHHIAYCELRGRTRLQIESKNRDNNKPNETYIQQIKEKYAWTIEEIEAYKERTDAKALCLNS